MELHEARGSNGFGYNPISYQDILSWAILTCRTPSSWEVSTIKALDALFLNPSEEQQESE